MKGNLGRCERFIYLYHGDISLLVSIIFAGKLLVESHSLFAGIWFERDSLVFLAVFSGSNQSLYLYVFFLFMHIIVDIGVNNSPFLHFLSASGMRLEEYRYASLVRYAPAHEETP